MGLGTASIKLYLELYQRGVFKNSESVIEMGSQELHLKKLASRILFVFLECQTMVQVIFCRGSGPRTRGVHPESFIAV